MDVSNSVNFLEKAGGEGGDDGDTVVAVVKSVISSLIVVIIGADGLSGGRTPSLMACQGSPFLGSSPKVAACQAVRERAKMSAFGRWS